MIERRNIVDLWHGGRAAALVTLVRVQGSSYRRTGARMLIAADGGYAGSISGGCLEAEVVRKAAWLVRDGSVVERYSTLFDDTAEIPYGLGCGGTVDLLLEPAGTPEFTALMQALEASLRGQSFTIETVLPTAGQPLRRTIQARTSQPTAHSPSPAHYAACFSDTFRETLDPPQRLLIFGAGDDAKPMVQMAALLGWNITVIDSRPQWAKRERFPEASDVLVGSPRSQDPEPWTLDPLNAAAVIMSHSYEQDRAWLAALLPGRLRYLGLLGARHRSALLVSEAATILGWDIARACEGLFAPVGLDLGGDGAESIALAAIAEIKACCEGKLGVSRRMTPQIVNQLVAEQLAAGGASRYLQTQCTP